MSDSGSPPPSPKKQVVFSSFKRDEPTGVSPEAAWQAILGFRWALGTVLTGLGIVLSIGFAFLIAATVFGFTRIDRLGDRQDRLETKFEARLDSLNQQMDSIPDRMNAIANTIANSINAARSDRPIVIEQAPAPPNVQQQPENPENQSNE